MRVVESVVLGRIAHRSRFRFLVLVLMLEGGDDVDVVCVEVVCVVVVSCGVPKGVDWSLDKEMVPPPPLLGGVVVVVARFVRKEVTVCTICSSAWCTVVGSSMSIVNTNVTPSLLLLVLVVVPVVVVGVFDAEPSSSVVGLVVDCLFCVSGIAAESK